MKAFALVLALALTLPAAAAAKGPAAGAVTGPGLDRPIRLTGPGEPGSAGTLGRLAEASGLFAALGGSPRGTLATERPAGELGPRYTATFAMRDVTTREVRVDLYPYARPQPVAYVEEGQRPYGTGLMGHGWFAGGERLKAILVEAGLPTSPPVAGDDGFGLPRASAVAPALAAALAAFAAALVLLRRRPLRAR